MASAMGLHGVPRHFVEAHGMPLEPRGSPWKVRGSPWSVSGCPWNAVEIAVECRGGPWTLPRCSAKKTNNVHASKTPLLALRIPRRVVLRSGSTFHGETALRLPPSLKECVALLVARTTCNEGVPAHKEFLRARQTPVPLICIVCWVLACTAPGTRYFCSLRFSLFSFFSLRRMGKNRA